ncbi:GNAT family N-acetyltransferase [Aminipila luticellarii]|uniref:GNAT family N-acetyltransferase n=1 Tax=Aminipila luticellarii TaxID=2507160 RepID=A0A410PS80_9FIRM|nr:GNAT family N-acetyltransferase [Aminipila luticellarii]QAT41784.1 GNAT family N-acetyltransferase [Aminipila luticellarii]
MAAEIKGLIEIRDREKVIRTLMSAFSDYPQLAQAFPDKSRRLIVMEAALRFYAAFGMRYGGAYALDPACQGVAILLPSQKRKGSALKYFFAGSYSSQYKRAVSRMTEEEHRIRTELFAEISQMETEIKFPPKYLYISYLGVRPEYQGQGNGRMLMNRLVEYGEKKELPIVLITSEPKEVPFYQSMGFKMMGITSSRKFQFINIYLIK